MLRRDYLTSFCAVNSQVKHKITYGLFVILLSLLSCKQTYASSHKLYYVQLTAYLSADAAQRALQTLLSMHQPGRVHRSIVNGKLYYQVQVGPYSQLQQAKQAKKKLAAGYIRSYQQTSNKEEPLRQAKPQKVKQITGARTRLQPIKENRLVKSKELVEEGRPWSLVLAISGGPAWNNAGQTQAFFVQPMVAEAYIANKRSEALASGELFLGAQHKLIDGVSGQLGLAVAGSNDATLRGEIWNDADPDFDNFIYRYSISHWHVGVKAKLLIDRYSLVQPYVGGSIGAGFNRAHNFKIAPKIYEQLTMPPFRSNKETAFTYTLGAGLQKTLNSHWQIGMGYEFADWGSSRLGRATEQTIGTGLQLPHLYASQIQFSIGFVA